MCVGGIVNGNAVAVVIVVVVGGGSGIIPMDDCGNCRKFCS